MQAHCFLWLARIDEKQVALIEAKVALLFAAAGASAAQEPTAATPAERAGTSKSGGTGGTGRTTVIPEPGSLSLSLPAMGSVAVLAWRKMRKERAHQNQ